MTVAVGCVFVRELLHFIYTYMVSAEVSKNFGFDLCFTTDSWDKAFGLVVPHSSKNKSLIKVENHLHV